jgi:hypothetical protein
MPSSHAKLSPSSSERWITCPASIKMSAEIPPAPSSPYAAEGTAAHALGELKAQLRFGMIKDSSYAKGVDAWRREFAADIVDEDEMHVHTDAYVELLVERLELRPNSTIMLEQRMDTGVPRSWGTSDAVIVSPVHVEIVDFKYGAGVAVEAEGNSQLRLYALGALDTYGDLLGETEDVLMTVHQPRMNHVLTAEMTADALRAWRADVAIPAAELALGDDAPFGPSDTACRWCPASGQCRAQLEAVFAAPLDVDPKVLTADDIAEVLPKIPEIRNWLKAFEEAALARAYSHGEHLVGYKVVMSGGIRQITDHPAAIRKLIDAGYDPEEVSVTKAKGIGELDKLVKRDGFKVEDLLGELVGRTDGRPSLVPESDKRASIQPNSEAVKEFGEDLL